MVFSEDLLKQFILALEHTKIPVGGDVAIRLQHIFNLLGITNAEELSKHKLIIAPVVARSPEEQHRFYSAFDHFIEAAGVVKLNTATAASGAVKKNVRQARRNTLLLGLTVVVLVVCAYAWFYRSTPPVEIGVSASAVTENDLVMFINHTDPENSYSGFRWDYGDGSGDTATEVSTTHRYKKPGEYKVTLAAYLDDTVSSEAHAIITVAEDTTLCHVHPSFSHYTTSELDFVFRNTSTGECIQSYSWSFGDGSADVEYAYGVNDSVAHRFPKPGSYIVALAARGADTTNVYQEVIKVGAKTAPIELLPFAPVLKSVQPPEVKSHVNTSLEILLFCMLVLLPLALLFASHWFRKRRLTRIFTKVYPVPEIPVAPYGYRLDDSGHGLQGERKLGELAFRLRHPEQGDAIRLDVYPTINHTIRSAGFPKLFFNETTTQPVYVALVDLDSGVNQQVQLFRELLETLDMYRVNFTVFYFRGSMQTCFNDAYPDGISIEKISELYSGARLILYTDGASLLNSDADDGFVSWAPKIFNRWKNRTIITSVPRYNWDENERQLLKLFPLYPAGLNGHLVMAKAFIRGNHKLFARKKTVRWMNPFPADMQLYSQYFLEQGDRKLYTWLLALSVPQKTNWNMTLLVGKIVEDVLCEPGERLVTYANLLQITSVGWLQSGKLNSQHRQELYAALKKQPGAEQLIYEINRELQRELEKLTPPENSSAALEKKIQLTLLNYQLSGEKKPANLEHEVHFLHERGLLDRFTKANVYTNGKGFSRFNLRKALVVAGIGLVVFLSSFIPSADVVFGHIPGWKSGNDTISDTTTAAYYNNLAVELMKKTPAGSDDPDSVDLFLRKAYELDSLDDTIGGNYLIYQYRHTLNLYRQNQLNAAANSASDWYADSTSMLYDDLQFSSGMEGRVPDVNSLTGRARDYLWHAYGVSTYYLFPGDTAWHNTLQNISDTLEARLFYKNYPDTAHNLKTLLASGAAPVLPDTTYLLEIVAEDNSSNPVLSIKDKNLNLLASGYDKISRRLPPGEYVVVALYPKQSRARTIKLTSDTLVTIAFDLPQSHLLKVLVEYTNGTPVKSVKKMELTDLNENNIVYTDTAGFFNGFFPAHEYELNIVFSDFVQPIEEQFFLSGDTTIRYTLNPRTVKIHVDDVEGLPLDSVAVTNKNDGYVYGITDASGNLTFTPDPKFNSLTPLELSKGKYKQEIRLTDKWKTGAVNNFILEDYTGYTLVLAPLDVGEDKKVPAAEEYLYQQSIVEVLREMYPNDKFVAVPLTSEDYSTTALPGPYAAARAVVECSLTRSVDNGGAFQISSDAFQIRYYVPDLQAQQVQLNEMMFSCTSADYEEFRNVFRKELKQGNPKGGSWGQQIQEKK